MAQQAGTGMGRGEFARATDPFRRELLAHCYRMLGSIDDAEDLVQETYLRAWRSYEGFEGRSSVRTWLYRIATNACLTAIDRRGRRPLPLVAAWQYLSARQRAVLILRDVLDWPAAQVADLLDTSTAAVNSALRRARAQIADVLPAENSVAEPADLAQRAVLDQFMAAFEHADVAALARLLRDDVVLEMPPLLTWFAGRDNVTRFFATQVFPQTQFRMVATTANGQPAAAGYHRDRHGGYQAHALTVLTVTAAGIARIDTFLDPGLFPAFGLPGHLPASRN